MNNTLRIDHSSCRRRETLLTTSGDGGGAAVLERPTYTQLCAIRFSEIRFRISGEYPLQPRPTHYIILLYNYYIRYYTQTTEFLIIIYTRVQMPIICCAV